MIRREVGLFESADGGWLVRRVTYDYGVRWHLLRAVWSGDPDDPSVEWEWIETFAIKDRAIARITTETGQVNP